MHKYFLISIFIFLYSLSFSQTGTIRGFVYELNTGEPVVFVNVFLKGTSIGAATDVNGYFSISKIPSGNYVLMITSMGHDTLAENITIEKNQLLTKNYFLLESTIKLEEFLVSADAQERKKEIQASVTKVNPIQISMLPSVGAQPDIAQYLQVVPGVVFTGDQGGQLYIRGGSPIQNKVLLDGMVIYNPFHSIGLFSVFDSDLIKNADIYTGGFNAQYSGRISSVMDITTRDGNKKKVSGKLNGDTFGSKLLLEVPIIKQNDNNKMSLTAVGSLKTSYIDETSKTLYAYANEEGIPFGYTDAYGKISLNGLSGSKVNIFGFNFNDYVNSYDAVEGLNWKSSGIGSNIVLVPQGSSVLVTANAAYSNYLIEMASNENVTNSSGIAGFNMGLNFTYFKGNDQFDYGLELLGCRTDFNYQNSIGLTATQQENSTELGVYARYKKELGKLIIEPGLRLQYYASLSELSAEPRIGIKYKVNDKIRIKSAAGLYSQNLIAANSDKDIVNLFYGFLTGPKDLQESFDGKEITSALQKSKHLILGFEWDLSHRLFLNVEGYYKFNSQMTELNRNRILNDDASNAAAPDILKEEFIIEKGEAYGIDVALKYDYKKIYLWLVYSLGYVNRQGEFVSRGNGIEMKNYIPHFDRRHSVNLMASYTFGKDLNWDFSARWNFGSGFPFTPTKGYYENVNLSDGIKSDYTKVNGDLAYLLGDINSKQLPSYHRLDLTLKRSFFISSWSELQIIGSVTNVYNRSNIFYVNRVEMEKVYQLPILPSIGASLTF